MVFDKLLPFIKPEERERFEACTIEKFEQACTGMRREMGLLGDQYGDEQIRSFVEMFFLTGFTAGMEFQMGQRNQGSDPPSC